MPVIPSADLKRSLRFWSEGLELTVTREMYREGKLIGCMVHNDHVFFWLNERADGAATPSKYEGIRLYWAPTDIQATRDQLKQLGFGVSDIVDRDYGQTEFFVTDDDGHEHCFGIPTRS